MSLTPSGILHDRIEIISVDEPNHARYDRANGAVAMQHNGHHNNIGYYKPSAADIAAMRARLAENDEERLALQGHKPSQEDHSQVTRDLIPRLPLDLPRAIILGLCAVISLLCGASLISLGAIMAGVVHIHGKRKAPPLWWVGLLPLVVGVVGINASCRKNRSQTYVWGLCILLIGLVQTAVMGWVGNFSTSHYDAWPPFFLERESTALCMVPPDKSMCYCIDKYHGVYSHLQLPGVHYFYNNKTRWRETMFESCDTVLHISQLYYSVMGIWGVYLITAILACILAHSGSICAPKKQKFLRLDEDEVDSHLVPNADDDSSELWGHDIGDGPLRTSSFTETPLNGLLHDYPGAESERF